MSAVYTILKKKAHRDAYQVHALIAYSAEAYSSGLAVSKAGLSLPVNLQQLLIESATPGDQSIYKYDPSSQKIRIYEQDVGGTETFAEVSGAQTVNIRVIAEGY